MSAKVHRLAPYAGSPALERMSALLPPRPQGPPAPRMADIKREVADRFLVSVRGLEGKGAHQSICRPRQIAMWIAFKATNLGYSEIARHFGGRDHTTVIWAVRRIEAALTEDPALWDDVHALLAILATRLPE